MNKKIIIFDMDGVLFDSIPIARKYFTDRHPGVTGEMYDDLSKGNYHEEVVKYSHLRLSEAEEKKLKDQTSYSDAKSRSPMFDGMKDLLKGLHNNGYILVLNTSAFAKNTLPLLQNAEIENLFNLIATAELSKSKVKKFEQIKKRYKTDKKNILFITDSIGDVVEAKTASIPTIAVTWGIHNRADFVQYSDGLVGVVDSVEELKLAIIDKIW
jgi:AHBA synthesis associated protein